MIYLACKKCGRKVSGFLKNQTESINANRPSDYVSQKENILVSRKHRSCFWAQQRHKADGTVDLVCPGCHTPIAQEISDSGSAEAHIRVPSDLVEMATVQPEFSDKLYEIEKNIPIGLQYIDDLLTLMKWNPAELRKQLKKFVRA